MAKGRKFALALMAVMLVALVSAHATSHVRIVRLSYEDGNVQMSRAAGQGLERAILNSPVVEGSSVVTGGDGLAEVEFENNSTIRLGGATDMTVRQLLINDAGELINEVELVRGVLYFDTRGGKNNVYRVVAADRIFVVQRNAQVRFQMIGDQVEVAVLNGEVQLQDNAEMVKIKKKDTLTVDPTNPAGFVLAKGVDSHPLDRWNSERDSYQTAYANINAGYSSFGGPSKSGSGGPDLAYYGDYFLLPGYGAVWQPYGAASWLGWNPYLAGTWAFVPSVGYAWASAYPWGWLPYHYGSWAYSTGVGWFWVPGNSFQHGGTMTNWQPTAPVVNGPAGYNPPTPPTTPVNGMRPSVVVGRIGRSPAYIPGGPVPPNFRSVIDHSSIVGMTAPMSGASSGGSSTAASRNSRAMNMNGSNSDVARGRTFASPGTGSSNLSSNQANAGRGANHSGHVFMAPSAPGGVSMGDSAPLPPSFGSGATPMHGASAPMQGSAVPMRSSGGASHAGSARGTPRSTATTNPK